jgi:hypothetical protein
MPFTIHTVSSNRYRPSTADPAQNTLYGPSREYPVEEWLLDYFFIEKNKSPVLRTVACMLPLGYEHAYERFGDKLFREGPIDKVRAWGIQFMYAFLRFCPDYERIRNGLTKTQNEKRQFNLEAVAFELPGYFMIASNEHPLIAYSPSKKKFIYDYWLDEEQAIYYIQQLQK